SPSGVQASRTRLMPSKSSSAAICLARPGPKITREGGVACVKSSPAGEILLEGPEVLMVHSLTSVFMEAHFLNLGNPAWLSLRRRAREADQAASECTLPSEVFPSSRNKPSLRIVGSSVTE